jgi:hypothetical protein
MYLITDNLGTEEPYAQENYICYNVVLRVFFFETRSLQAPRLALLFVPVPAHTLCHSRNTVAIHDLLLSR